MKDFFKNLFLDNWYDGKMGDPNEPDAPDPVGWRAVPIDECRKLKPGLYLVRNLDEDTVVEKLNGPLWDLVTHIFNPENGPLPEVER